MDHGSARKGGHSNGQRVDKGMEERRVQDMDRRTNGKGKAEQDIPPKGWRKGLHLVCGYAPTSTAPVAYRNKHWQEMQRIVNSTAA